MKKYPSEVNIIYTDSRETIEKYGISRGVYINGEAVAKRMASCKEIEVFIEKV